MSTGSEYENFYVEDGIVEFKDNILSILTSSILNLKNIDKTKIDQSINESEKFLADNNINDQKRFLENQKIEVLKLISNS